MVNDYTPNKGMPDFSQLVETSQKLQKMTQSSVEAAIKLQEMMRHAMEAALRIQEVFRPVVEFVASHKVQIVETTQKLINASKVIAAINKLADAQYVCWVPINRSLVDTLILSTNTDETLEVFLAEDKYASVNATIVRTQEHPFIEKNAYLYTQAVNAFNMGFFDLAVNGFTSVFDGILADASGNTTHSLNPRIKTILSKLERDEVLENEEYATLTLALTFQETIESFSQNSPFNQPEPNGLNRHWIAHGRSTRVKTKLDAIKMINLIYGVLLIYDLDALTPTNQQ